MNATRVAARCAGGWARPTNCALRSRSRISAAFFSLAWWAEPTLLASQSSTPQSDDPGLAAVLADEARRVETFAKAAQSVVCIFETPERGGGGSGVIIHPEGYGLTNYHVVQAFIESRRGYGGLNDGKLYPLMVLGIDPGGDIVMFKLSGRDTFAFAPLGDSDKLHLGQFAAAMGNPFLVAEDFTPTITFGNISGLHRYQEGQGNLLEYADCIQVSTSINPGNSGGPLFDLSGAVIGINGRGSFEERGRVNVGLGYAVTCNQIKRFLPGLYAGRLMLHGTLGVTVQQLGDDVIINAMQELSPAEKAGLRLADKLLTINGRRIRTPNDFTNAVTILPADWPVNIRVARDGKEIAVVARTERLGLRTPIVYVPDLDRNHEQVRRLFSRCRMETGIVQDVEAIEMEVAIATSAAPSDERSRLRIDLTAAGDSQSPESMNVGGPAIDAAFLTELRVLLRPLLCAPKLDISWELAGGDEMDGRVVYVVQREMGPRRARWFFALDSERVVRMELADLDGKNAVEWSAGEWRVFGALRWPGQWTRRAGESVTTIECTAFGAAQ